MRARLVLFWSVIAVAGVLAAAPSAYDSWPAALQDAGPHCVRCKSTGRQPCGEHGKEEAPWEDEVLYCSVIADCEVCLGTGWIDCKYCDNEAAVAELAARAERVRRRGEELKKFDDEMGRPLTKCETDGFQLVFELESLKIDRRNVGQHELMHLYARRLEAHFADYLELLGASRADFKKKTRVFVWYHLNDQRKGSVIFCGAGADNGVKLLGADPGYSVCGNRQFFKGDEELHRNLVHMVNHLLFSHEAPSYWVGNKKGGWIEAGLGHWFEDKYFDRADNYCYQEQNTNQDFKGGRWRPQVRKMVAEADHPSMAEVFEQNTDTLTLPMHRLSFSYVDYLLQLDPRGVDKVGRLMRAKMASRDALSKAFDMNVLQFEERWKQWVLDTYPTR